MSGTLTSTELPLSRSSPIILLIALNCESALTVVESDAVAGGSLTQEQPHTFYTRDRPNDDNSLISAQNLSEAYLFSSTTTDRQSVVPTFSILCVTGSDHTVCPEVMLFTSDLPSGEVVLTLPAVSECQRKGNTCRCIGSVAPFLIKTRVTRTRSLSSSMVQFCFGQTSSISCGCCCCCWPLRLGVKKIEKIERMNDATPVVNRPARFIFKPPQVGRNLCPLLYRF